MSSSRATSQPSHRARHTARHRRRRRTFRPVALVVPAGVVGIAGLAVVAPGATGSPSAAPVITPTLAVGGVASRAPERPSRSSSRAALQAREPAPSTLAAASRAREQRIAPPARPEPPPPRIAGTRFTTTGLNVRTGPGENTQVVAVLDRGTKIRITDRVRDGWRMVEVDGVLRWVSSQYLARTRPPEPPAAAQVAAAGGLSGAPCGLGSSIESGLVPNAVAVYRAVCAAFPQVTSYGGYRPGEGSYHGSGQAVDVMVSGALGDQIAAWLQSNAGTLGISELIWSQRIWTVQRAGEGWRPMSDRGSTTANHYDHVHVSVY